VRGHVRVIVSRQGDTCGVSQQEDGQANRGMEDRAGIPDEHRMRAEPGICIPRGRRIPDAGYEVEAAVGVSVRLLRITNDRGKDRVVVGVARREGDRGNGEDVSRISGPQRRVVPAVILACVLPRLRPVAPGLVSPDLATRRGVDRADGDITPAGH